ncbi:Polynucleotidyl transferase- ribonuclease H-like superfamily protein [Striga hermonthica]|uniref:Polynucleotidyl transferase- ribonuclease H-like superfamily protein n=1 Tax=Striga hermonthica TaxID=68872 RepID=A0A9N7MPV6_STRHE|nr:Polynucleotidyl transferase- ribonuclease H-like superfamily protein [Striga hermonthica]
MDPVPWFENFLWNHDLPMIMGCEWSKVFAAVLWRLWKRRCEVVFDSHAMIDGEKVLNVIASSIRELVDAYPPKGNKMTTGKLIAWLKPEEGFVKLNTDGAAKVNPGVAGAGGLIRDEEGRWRTGFMAHLGVCTNTVAELLSEELGMPF